MARLDGTSAEEPDNAGTAAGAPGIPPWLQRPFDLVWLILLAAAVVVPVLGVVADTQGTRENIRTFGRVGLLVYGPAGGPPRMVPLNREAQGAGIRYGDVLLSVNGRALTGDRLRDNQVARSLAGPSGTSVAIVSRSADGTVREHRLVRSADIRDTVVGPAVGLGPQGIRLVQTVPFALAPFLLVGAAILLHRQRKRQWVAGLLSAALLLVAISNFISQAAFARYGLVALMEAIQAVGWTSLTYLLLVFPDGRFGSRAARWLAVAMIPFFAAGMLQVLPWQAQQGIGSALLLAAAGLLALRFRRAEGVKRQQIGWALFGFALSAIFVTIGVVTNIVAMQDVTLPVRMWSWIVSANALALAAASMAAGLLVSMLRYRLYDADAVVARSASIGALTVLLLGIFAGTEKVIEVLGEEWFGEELGVLAGGVGAALAAVLIVPLHHRLTDWAERRFRKQLIRLRTGLPALVGDLRDTAPVQRIAAATLDSVVAGVRARRAGMLVDGAVIDARGIDIDEVATWKLGWLPSAAEGFDIDTADPLFPLRVPLEADGHGRIGWLLLGPRPDGSFYGKDEREALAAIADPVARALEIAARREAREADERARWHGQEALNGKILEMLAAIHGELKQLSGPKTSARRKRTPASEAPAAAS